MGPDNGEWQQQQQQQQQRDCPLLCSAAAAAGLWHVGQWMAVAAIISPLYDTRGSWLRYGATAAWVAGPVGEELYISAVHVTGTEH